MAGNTITQRIQLVGGDEIKVQLEGIGKAGQLAFTRLSAAANATAAVGKQAQGSFESLAAGSARAAELSAKLKDLQGAVGGLTEKFPQLANAAGRFAQRITLTGVAAVAAGRGIARAALNVAQQVNGQSDSLEKMTQAQIDANNAALSTETAQINLEATLRKLNQQAREGKISWEQYRESVKTAKQDFADQQRVANEVAAAQDRVKEANDRLQKQMKDRQAFQKLADTFGGPLLSSLIAFGNQVEQIRQKFIQDFSPAAAKVVDLISNVVSKNSVAINNFLGQASSKLSALIAQNGPQLQLFFENMGKAAAAVFDGLIKAAPAVITFFNNSIVPALSKVSSLFTTLANVVNAVFGTQFTGGSIFIIALLANMTGSIKFLMALLKVFGASWKALGAVVTAFGEVVNVVLGGGKIASGIIRLGSAVTTSGGAFSALFNIVRAGIPLISGLATVVAGALGISFGSAVVVVGALAAALIFLLTKVDWSAFASAAKGALAAIIQGVQNIISATSSAIGAVVGFIGTAIQAVVSAAKAILDAIATIPAQVGQLFSGLASIAAGVWAAIAKGAADMWAAVSGAFSAGINSLVGFFQALPQNIAAIFAAIVQFFNDTWTNATQLAQAAADAITQAFKGTVDSIVGFFGGLFQSVSDVLTRIISLAKQAVSAVADAMSSATGDGGAQSNARGGYIRGPGTGTSDSILSWLSNGEYVIKAAAVRKFGIGFFNALNGLRMPQFSTGGAVRAVSSVASAMLPPIPRFAQGGLVTVPSSGANGRPFTLQIGAETFAGLTASQDTVDRLERFAVRKQVRSAGRKPAWFNG